MSKRLALGASGVLLVGALFYLVLNSVVYGIFRLHVDAFWLWYIFGSYKGFGLPALITTIGLVVLAGVAALEWGLFFGSPDACRTASESPSDS